MYGLQDGMFNYEHRKCDFPDRLLNTKIDGGSECIIIGVKETQIDNVSTLYAPYPATVMEIIFEYHGSTVVASHLSGIYNCPRYKLQLRISYIPLKKCTTYTLSGPAIDMVNRALEIYLGTLWGYIKQVILEGMDHYLAGSVMTAALDYGLFEPGDIDIFIVYSTVGLHEGKPLQRPFDIKNTIIERLKMVGFEYTLFRMGQTEYPLDISYIINVKVNNITYQLILPHVIEMISDNWRRYDLDICSVALIHNHIFIDSPQSNFHRYIGLDNKCYKQRKINVRNIIPRLLKYIKRGYHVSDPTIFSHNIIEKQWPRVRLEHFGIKLRTGLISNNKYSYEIKKLIINKLAKTIKYWITGVDISDIQYLYEKPCNVPFASIHAHGKHYALNLTVKPKEIKLMLKLNKIMINERDMYSIEYRRIRKKLRKISTSRKQDNLLLFTLMENTMPSI